MSRELIDSIQLGLPETVLEPHQPNGSVQASLFREIHWRRLT